MRQVLSLVNEDRILEGVLMRSNRWSASLGTVVAALIVSMSAGAQEPERRLGHIQIEHRTGQIIVKRWDDTVRRGDLATENAYLLRRREAASVVVIDPNPFLFSFTAGEVESVKTSSYRDALAFAQALSQLLPGVKAQSLDTGGVAKGHQPWTEFDNAIALMQSYLKRIPPLITKSAGTRSDVAEVKSEANGWNLEQIEGELNDGYKRIAPLLLEYITTGVDVSGIRNDSSRAAIEALVARVRKIALERDAKAEPLTQAQLVDLARILEGAQGAAMRARAIPDGNSAFVGGNSGRPSVQGMGDREAQSTEIEDSIRVLARGALRSTVIENLAKLKAFQVDVARIDEPITLMTIEYDLDDIKSVPITIAVTSEHAKLARSTGRTEGAFVFRFQPYSALTFQLRPAYVYSFVRESTYEIVEGDLGTKTIAESRENYTASTVGAMLNVVPSALVGEAGSVHLQVGVSPINDQFGFYFGGGVSFHELFSLSLGLAVQQVKGLSSGLSVGDEVADASALKTEPDFRRGLYVAVDVKLPK